MKRMLSIALSAALVLSLTGCQKGQEAGGSGSGGETAVGVAVQVTEVEQDTIAAENKVSGQVVTDSETSVFVAANAQCTAVYVEAGDTVSAGQAICTLDMASTLASYNSASISYQASAQSYQDQAAIFDKQIALAEKNVNDLKALFEIGAAAQIEIDQARLSLQSAKAQGDATLSQLEAGMQSTVSSLEQLSAVLENVDSRGNVIAPVSGVITSLSAVKDSYVAPSMPVAVIDGADQMKVSVSVSEALIPKLAVGSEADITISALSASFTGEIRTVEQSANPQTRDPVRLCGGEWGHRPLCGGADRIDGQRGHRDHLRAVPGGPAGDGGASISVRWGPCPGRDRRGVTAHGYCEGMYQA